MAGPSPGGARGSVRRGDGGRRSTDVDRRDRNRVAPRGARVSRTTEVMENRLQSYCREAGSCVAKDGLYFVPSNEI